MIEPNEITKYMAGLDDAELERPTDFDYDAAIAAVQAVRAAISSRTGYGANAVEVQDATFFASLVMWGESIVRGQEMVSIVFSAFGGLVTIFNRVLLPTEQEQRIVEALRQAGCVYVPEELAAQPYQGSNPRFKNQTWAARYFDFL